MRTAYAVALLFLVLPLAGCAAKAPMLDQAQRLGYVLDTDAHADDLFCVVTEPGPLIEPTEIGLHCTSVLAVRKWIASQRYAE